MLTPNTLLREKPTPVLEEDLDTIGKEKVSRQMKFLQRSKEQLRRRFLKENVHALGERKSNSIAGNSKIPHTEAVVLLKVKWRIKHSGSLDEWWTRLLARTEWFVDWTWGKEMDILSSVPCNLCVTWKLEERILITSLTLKQKCSYQEWGQAGGPNRLPISCSKTAAQEVEDGDWHLSWWTLKSGEGVENVLNYSWLL